MSKERVERFRLRLKPISHERAEQIMEECTRPEVQRSVIINVNVPTATEVAERIKKLREEQPLKDKPSVDR